MKVVGIIAEYNPFHKGHAYQIRYAKERLGADYVIVAMSGPFTQRGTPALFDKYSRADHALACGADLVLELPVVYATASAQVFATGGVALLQNTGLVDTLLFGSECPDLATLKNIADRLSEESPAYQTLLRQALQEGSSYAAARAKALENPAYAEILAQPNNILAIEYLGALSRLGSAMTPLCLQRQGAGYHETSLDEDMASASGIRHFLADHPQMNDHELALLLDQIPEALHPSVKELIHDGQFLFADDTSLLLHYALMGKQDFAEIADSNFDISNKILQNRHSFASFHSFCQLLKSKDLAYSRISRVLCHILLDIKKQDMLLPNNACPLDAKELVPYLRILGFSDNGRPLLKQIKKNGAVPLITSPQNAKGLLSLEAMHLLDKDIFASDVYRMMLSNKTGQFFPNEYTRKFS